MKRISRFPREGDWPILAHLALGRANMAARILLWEPLPIVMGIGGCSERREIVMSGADTPMVSITYL